MSINIRKIFLISCSTSYLIFLFILPFKFFKIGYLSAIFPAIDITILYYLTATKRINYSSLFIIGLFLDQLYYMPYGTNSFALILASMLFTLLNDWFLLKNYKTNLIIFCVYSFFIISIRYLIVTIASAYHIEGSAIYFHYIITVLSYPTLKIIIEEPLKILSSYAG